MKHLGPHAQGFPKIGSPQRNDHEFLGVDGVIGMGASIQDIHHRDRENPGRDPAQIAVEGHIHRSGRGPGNSHGDGQDGVGPQSALVRGSVEGDHFPVHLVLTIGVHSPEGLGDFPVGMLHRPAGPLPEITVFLTVSKLNGFVLAR